MRGTKTPTHIQKEIRNLRLKGFSISEISKKVGKSKSIVFKYSSEVKISDRVKKILISKRDWSKNKSKEGWKNAEIHAKKLIKNLSKKEKLLILSSLYWGEGTKKELNIINGDPRLLKVTILCLKDLGINNNELRLTLRLYNGMSSIKAVDFWSAKLNLPKNCFKNVNFINGNKVGRLPHGMCRVRVEKSEKYFKLIISVINRIDKLLP